MRMRSIAVLGMCLLAAGCTRTWEPQYGPSPQVAAAHQGRTVRVVMKGGGAHLEIRDMRVEGDSMIGETGNPPSRVAVATEDVQVISISRHDAQSPANTLITTIGIVAVTIVLASVWLFVELMDELP